MRNRYKQLIITSVLLFCNLFFAINLHAIARRSIIPSDNLASTIGIASMPNARIVNQTLTIDFRKNDLHSRAVLVTNVYEVEVVDSVAFIPFTFNAYNVFDYNLYVDDVAVSRDTLKSDSLYLNIAVPDSVQWQNNSIPYFNLNYPNNPPHSKSDIQNIFFTIHNLSAGKHIIKTICQAYPSEWFQHSDLAVYKSLIHLLSPVIDSANSYDNLHLTIIYPEGLDYEVNVPITSKEVKDEAVYLKANFDKLPVDYISITMHKNDKAAIFWQTVFIVVACVLAVGICLIWLIVVAKKTILKNNKPKLVRAINYIFSLGFLVIQLLICVTSGWSVVYYLSLLSIFGSALIVIKFFNRRHKSKMILYYINCLSYLLTLLIFTYLIFHIDDESAFIYIIISIVFLLILRAIYKYSSKRRTHHKVVQFLNNNLIALFVTFAFYIIFFNAYWILVCMLGDYISPWVSSDVLIILFAPIIFIVALASVMVVNFIVNYFIKKTHLKYIL